SDARHRATCTKMGPHPCPARTRSTLLYHAARPYEAVPGLFPSDGTKGGSIPRAWTRKRSMAVRDHHDRVGERGDVGKPQVFRETNTIHTTWYCQENFSL